MTKKRTIAEYIHSQKLAKCVVCAQVTPELLQQIRTAQKSSNVVLDTILAWLKAEHGIALTRAQWQAHATARHRVATNI